MKVYEEGKETTYIVTEREIEKIRAKGRVDVIKYIQYTWANFPLALNIYGAIQFYSDILNFVFNKNKTIRNEKDMGFFEFVKELDKNAKDKS